MQEYAVMRRLLIFSISHARFFQGRRLFQNRISKITDTNYDFYVKKKMLKVPILHFLLRQNRNSLDAEDCKVLPTFFFYPQINFMIIDACYTGYNKHHILLKRCGVDSRAAFVDNFDSICAV